VLGLPRIKNSGQGVEVGPCREVAVVAFSQLVIRRLGRRGSRSGTDLSEIGIASPLSYIGRLSSRFSDGGSTSHPHRAVISSVWAKTLVVFSYRKVKCYLDRQRGIVRPTVLFIDIDLAEEEAECVQQGGLARPVWSDQRNQTVTSEVNVLRHLKF
jgi:hypothetical protein